MTIRWGLLGCGDIARKRVARALIDAPGSTFRSAYRRDPDKLRAFCKDFQVPRACASEAELLADTEIDAVYIATPVKDHLPQTSAAARAGKHVLVEKPMALSAAECQQMIDICTESGVQLGVAYYRRFYPIVQRMKELVAAGAIGKPMSIAAVTSTTIPAPHEEGYWRVVRDVGGGGALMDIGSHRLDLFLDLFGPVADVVALHDTLSGNFEGEDCVTLALRFDAGTQGSLQCFFGTPAEADEFTITGTKGRLIASPLNGARLIVKTSTAERAENLPPPTNLHEPLVADFVAALQEKRPPRVTGHDGLRVNEVMARAYASADKNRGDRIYHIVARADWEKTGNSYRHPSLDSEGFIHCSRRGQVAWVANLFYADQQDLVVLAIDPGKLSSAVKYETIETGARFPHVYGPIERAAVVEVQPLLRDGQGRWTF